MKSIDAIMHDLDLYADSIGIDSYISECWEYENANLTLKPVPTTACQQVREEIKKFGEVLLKQPWYKSGTGLEIGLGFYGSTHIFWRNFFAKTITIEVDEFRLRRFIEYTKKFYQTPILDKGSYFINNASHSPQAVGKSYNFADNLNGGIDFLFIDGDHNYYAVLTDWLLYSPLVKKGGIVAFHDSCNKDFGVSNFLNHLESGAFGEAPKLELIQHSKCVGISYYFKP